MKAAKGVAYGMALHGMVTYALRLRMHTENMFMLITTADMLDKRVEKVLEARKKAGEYKETASVLGPLTSGASGAALP